MSIFEYLIALVSVVIGLAVALRPVTAPAHALLLSWVTVMLLPNLLSIEGVPHGLRSSAALPAVALLAGIGLAVVERYVARWRAAHAAAAALLILALLGAWTAYRYFIVWGQEPRVVAAHDGPYRSAARALLAAPPGVSRILVANGTGFPAYGRPAETHPFMFEMRDAPPVVILPGDADRLALNGRPALIALVHRSDDALALIRRLNPGAPIRPLVLPGGSADAPVYRIN